MPPARRQNKDDKPKRQRKRKARTTEVSSSSESDSSDSEVQPKKKTVIKTEKKVTLSFKKSHSAETLSSDNEEQSTPAAPSAPQVTDTEAEDAFTSFYLRQMTTEFAEDLDKIRSAGDFNDRNLGLLIGALKQGTSCFDDKERLSVGKAIAAAAAATDA